VASSSAADENDMDQARKLGRASLWVNVAGLICTAVTMAIFIPLYVVFKLNEVEYYEANNHVNWG
jgi:hypothetical protein